MDQCNQGQLLPDESIDDGTNTRPTELIPYLLQLEQNLMPVLPVIKSKKSKITRKKMIMNLFFK